VESELNVGEIMKPSKNFELVNNKIPAEELDTFVVSVIEALKDAKDKFAVAKIKNLTITDDMRELFLFVGISSKQVENAALFAWTETVKTHGDDF
jgi:hypothetical protein